ncbi:MAG: MarR family winged helix-turn-helix transcriptional regulator [Candidatus Levyibacteriota bacterium]
MGAVNIDTELFELMFQVSKNFKEKMAGFAGAVDITMLQFMALSFIEKNKSVHVKDVADYFSIEMPTATSLLNKLAKLKLIKRMEDRSDRRVVKITLTEKGAALLTDAKKIQKKNMKKTLSVLSEKQKVDMRDILTTILEKSHV